MSDKKINLEEFLCNHGVDGYKDSFKLILLDFGKQLLKLAAENASLNIPTNDWQQRWIEKKSITNTINQVK